MYRPRRDLYIPRLDLCGPRRDLYIPRLDLCGPRRGLWNYTVCEQESISYRARIHIGVERFLLRGVEGRQEGKRTYAA